MLFELPDHRQGAILRVRCDQAPITERIQGAEGPKFTRLVQSQLGKTRGGKDRVDFTVCGFRPFGKLL
jgi:hypothetical protein